MKITHTERWPCSQTLSLAQTYALPWRGFITLSLPQARSFHTNAHSVGSCSLSLQGQWCSGRTCHEHIQVRYSLSAVGPLLGLGRCCSMRLVMDGMHHRGMDPRTHTAACGWETHRGFLACQPVATITALCTLDGVVDVPSLSQSHGRTCVRQSGSSQSGRQCSQG